ncbi:DUF4263 domain-containing protein [Puteibacter caeruleilacunae]|nr:DUF4263 domain-containing protein [Puteibacter caeruleilacunae]
MSFEISDDCIACGTCIDECPVEAISEGDIYSIDSDLCISCGICTDVCPVEAPTVGDNREEREEELEIPQIKTELIFYLTLSGEIKVLVANFDENGILIPEQKLGRKFDKTPLGIVNKRKQYLLEKAEELEYLISKENVKESDIQKFFERNPEFILDGEYCEAFPQIILEEDGRKSKPDFILKPNTNVPAKILELKLPKDNVVSNFSRGAAFTQKVTRAVGQLNKYKRFFESKENRIKFQNKYHFNVYCPRLALIVGKDVSHIDSETLLSLKQELDKIDIVTYNDLLNRFRQKIKQLFN